MQAISCTELNDMLSASESIVLVDVRSPDEQNVSMLPGHVVRQQTSTGTYKTTLTAKLSHIAPLGSEVASMPKSLLTEGFLPRFTTSKAVSSLGLRRAIL